MKPTPSASNIERLAMTGRTREEASKILWGKWRREALFDLLDDVERPMTWSEPDRLRAKLAELVRILYNSEQ